MRPDSRPATEDLGRWEVPEFVRPVCTPASLAGWFAPPARLGARRSGRERARGSAARWQGWPVSADVLDVPTDTF